MLCFLVFSSFPLNTQANANSSYKGTVNTHVLNMREQPTTNSKVVGRLINKQEIVIVSERNGWGEISFNSKPAYVSLSFVTKNKSATPVEIWMTPNVSVLNVREKATINSQVIGKLKKGQPIHITGKEGTWSIFVKDNKNHYVSTFYLTKTSKPSTPVVAPVAPKPVPVAPKPTPVVPIPVAKLTGEITAPALNIRKSPNTNSAIVGTYKKNEIVEFTIENNSWAKVTFKNKTAYVYKMYLSEVKNESPKEVTPPKTQPAPIVTKVGTISTAALNVRSEPSALSNVQGLLKKGDTITIQSTHGDWLGFTYQNKKAYVHGGFVTIKTTESTPTPAPIVTKVGTISTAELNVRSEPSALSNVQGLLKKGDTITIQSTHGDWLGFTYQNKKAYVHGGFVTIKTTESTPTPPKVEEPKPTPPKVEQPKTDVILGYVTAIELNARALPNTTSKVLTVLSKDAKVEIVNVSNNWGKIKFNNDFAYVSMSYIKYDAPKVAEPTKETYSYIVNTATLNVRSSASIISAVIQKVHQGETLDVLSEQGGWLEIKKDNQNGFVSKKYVQKTAVDGISTPDITLTGKTIVVDAGHGGKDGGAMANGLREKDVALDVSLKLKANLEKAGAKVIMTRTDDTYYSLSERVNVSNSLNPDLFISIHVNAAGAKNASGIETFYFDGGDVRSKNSLKLAQSVQRDLVNQLGFANRGVKTGYFQVIRYTKSPSVLAELGFVSNSYEASKLAQNSVRDTLASSLLSGIQNYFE